MPKIACGVPQSDYRTPSPTNVTVSNSLQPTRRQCLPIIGTAAACTIFPTWAGQAPALAAALERDYDRYASSYDDLDNGTLAAALGLPELRRRLVSQARGTSLEVGVGTGLNLGYWEDALRHQRITSLKLVDLSQGMLEKAKMKASNLHLPPDMTDFYQANVESLPFDDGIFDTVLDTFSLCVFDDPVSALRSMSRVLRSNGGELLLLEHSRAKNPLLGSYQDLTAGPIQQFGGKGCLYNQDVVGLVNEAGLAVKNVEEHLGGLIVSVTAIKTS